MKKLGKIAVFIGCIIGVAAVFYFILQLTIGPKHNTSSTSSVTTTKTTKKAVTKQVKVEKKQNLKLVALGDSLTFGVGDTTEKGGYVGLIKQKLDKDQPVKVTTYNAGKTGDRSDQIEKRTNESTEIQTKLKEADVITMTVGGNDLMKVLQQNFLSLAQNKLSAAMPSAKEKYATSLQSLLTTVRKYNPDAPVFLISVYNPFFVYFPTLTQMQQYTDEWNEVAKDTLAKNDNMYFVDVNKQMSEGQYYGKSKKQLKKNTEIDLNDTSEAKLEQVLSQDKEKNDYLSDEDNFHPNNKGYRYITSQLYKVMVEHKKTWIEGDK